MNDRKYNGFIIMCIVISISFMIMSTVKIRELEHQYANVINEVSSLNTEISALNTEVDTLNNQMASLTQIVEETTKKKAITWDYNYVLRVVAAESKGEPIEGQMGVAQTIYETAKATGMTPEQVVKQPNQYAPPDSMNAVNDSVREACERVFVNGETVTDEPIRYFYSTVGGFVSKWHENSLEYVMTIGNHKFFKAK